MHESIGSKRYAAFGLTIESDIALHELTIGPDTGPADLTIRRQKIGRPLPALDEGVVFDYLDPEGVVMIWPDVAAFRLIGDSEILVEPYPDVPESYLAFPILGPIMAWMLDKRGLFILHASAIDVNGRSVVLMGDKMAGKSTTAAAFIRAGYPLVTDDLLAIDLSDPAAPKILPAFPQLKLSDESSAGIRLEEAEALPLVFEGFTKRQHRLGGMRQEPISLDWLFSLNRGGDNPRIERLGAGDAIVTLQRFSYMIRFASAPLTDKEKADRFRNCVAVANTAAVGRLHIPDSIERLGETVDLVVNRLAGEKDG